MKVRHIKRRTIPTGPRRVSSSWVLLKGGHGYQLGKTTIRGIHYRSYWK